MFISLKTSKNYLTKIILPCSYFPLAIEEVIAVALTTNHELIFLSFSRASYVSMTREGPKF